jgi:hypothetical protein
MAATPASATFSLELSSAEPLLLSALPTVAAARNEHGGRSSAAASKPLLPISDFDRLQVVTDLFFLIAFLIKL